MSQHVSIALYAPLLNYKKGYTLEFVREKIKELNLRGLNIYAQLKDEKLDSLDFLKDFTFLKELYIQCIDEPDL
ncbi:MAG: hypothetical protein RO257_10095 [Candidatus Kapabacteria bacterium]|nr:hypothetical protein [Candidatus Kapabacteria bacterium]